MQVSLFNSLNPNGRRVPVTITIEHVDDIGTNDGELIYLITLSTGARAMSGGRVNPVYLNNVSEQSIMSEIGRGLSVIGDNIDWGVVESDTAAPHIVGIDPLPNTSGVSIHSNVMVEVLDPYPASFVDESSIKLKVNNIDVTGQCIFKDKNGKIRLLWIPKRILT